MRYTVVIMSDKIKTAGRRRGAPTGTVNNPEGKGLRKDGELRDAQRISARVSQQIYKLLDDRRRERLQTDKRASMADAIIEAVDIAAAHGWRRP